MKIKKGDSVQLLLGKDRGKNGTVLKVFTKTKQVLVEGANVYKRHVKGRQGVEGGIIDITKPVDISNVGIVCKSCKKVTRVGYKLEGEVKTRVCRKCGGVI